ncbi:GntP family permease [Rhodococcus sp. WS4]|nr:GntP family permease [Rhodococcus sp. WS4]
MADNMIIMWTVSAIIGVVLLIVKAKIDPVIALILVTMYLGLVGGLGLAGTMESIADGFGSVMQKVGILIGIGVLLGSLMQATGTLERLVMAILSVIHRSRLPYAFALAHSTLLPSIYTDVQLILTAPLAKSAATHMKKGAIAHMGAAISVGIIAGNVFVVPGLAVMTVAGILDVSLSTMLLYGIWVGPLTAVISTFLFGLALRAGLWKVDTDELASVVVKPATEEGDVAQEEEKLIDARAGGVRRNDLRGLRERGVEVDADQRSTDRRRRVPTRSGPLFLYLLPVLVPIFLIGGSAIVGVTGVESGILDFLGNPIFALFVGLLGAYGLAWQSIGRTKTANAMEKGFATSGQILLLTGVGGSLGTVIANTALADTLSGMFSAESGMSVLLAIGLTWTITMILHVTIGSVNVAAVTAAGILAPVMGTLGVSPAIIVLALGSGAMFALTVNSNYFWMFQSILGLTTKGSLKAATLATCIGSVVSLVIISVLGLVA